MCDQPRPGDLRDDEPKQTMWTVHLTDVAKRSAVVWGVGLLLVIIVVGLGYALDVMMLAFAGLLFAIILRSLSDLINSYTRLGDNWSLVATVVLVIAVVGLGAWLLIPSIAEQTDQLGQTLPKSVERLKEGVKRYEWGRWVLEKTPEPDDLIPRRRDLFSQISGVVSGTLETIGITIVIFFTGIYLAAQPRLYIEGFVKLVPISKRDRAREVIGRIGPALKWWLVGKLVAIVFVGVLIWLGLFMIGVDLALTLAVLAALLTFIPNFGPIIAGVPAVLVSLLDSPMTALWVLVLYVAVQTIEGSLLSPLIQQQTVSLPPALTITAQLVMAVFVGGIGLALATPVTVVVMIMVQSLYVQDILGDESGTNDNGA